MGFQGLEGSLSFRSPTEIILFSECCEWLRQFAIALDESTVRPRKAKKSPDTLKSCWNRPFQDGIYFAGVHRHALFVDDMVKVFHRFQAEMTLLLVYN